MQTLNFTVLSVILIFAAWQDIRHFRIPNLLIFSGVIIGILLNILLPQNFGGIGMLASLAGFGVGLAILLPLYLLRALGAGDIKLMAMIGAFVGPADILMITVYVILAGGVLALAVVLLQGRLSKLIDNFKLMLLMRLAASPITSLPTTDTISRSAGKLPYGVAIAVGTLFYLVANYNIFS
ncbi:MAG: prepilin peptidase [Nitrosomonas sp.]|jgi:prepilin peptidase CpaA|nr:prepilin peptidase [Nitrosomonas sp.]